MIKQTKIGATIGPSCKDLPILIKMIKAGMNFARLNFSHGSYEDHGDLIVNLRKAEEICSQPIAILQDLQGPKIRLGALPVKGTAIKVGQQIILNTGINVVKEGKIPIDYPDLHSFLHPKHRILIDDGHIELKVIRVEGKEIICHIIEGGTLYSHKGLNLPDTELSIPVLTEKDRADLKFGVDMEVDMIALSFVKCAKDILDLRFLIKEHEVEMGKKNSSPISIIAKIERHEALVNLDEIMEVADGVMVARGDLGLEMPAAEVPLAQKHIIDIANQLSKPAIVATQMLDSMRENRRPTRAEVSDVANAVIDHADALLLTNETAVGKHPILTIKTMADIIRTIEKSSYDDTGLPKVRKKGTKIDTAITELARILSEEVNAELILTASISGETGRLISHVRPNLTILVGSTSQRVMRQLNISWGVRPFFLQPCHSIEELIERSIAFIKKNKIARQGELMIVVAGEPVGHAGNVNLVEVREIT
ncbi:MAG: pyruvate kinase [bacterium]